MRRRRDAISVLFLTSSILFSVSPDDELTGLLCFSSSSWLKITRY